MKAACIGREAALAGSSGLECTCACAGDVYAHNIVADAAGHATLLDYGAPSAPCTSGQAPSQCVLGGRLHLLQAPDALR